MGVAPSNARAGNGPSATILRGAISAIMRCKNGRYVAISVGLGGRSPGGRHGINGARQIAPRSNPMLRNICSRYDPTAPAHELPERSASAFGASPTNSRLHTGSPSRNSIFVAVSRSVVPSKPAIAARNSSSVVAAAAACPARSATLLPAAWGIAADRPADPDATDLDAADAGAPDAGAVDADTTAAARAGGGRSRSTGSASSASLAPHSICNRKAVSASIARARCLLGGFCATAAQCLGCTRP